jgi:amidohydrolase family protein
VAICAGLVCSLSNAASAQAPQGTTMAFTNVNVIPMDSERVDRDSTVLVRAGRIVAVGSRDNVVQVPPDAVVIDGRGQYLLPGLIDAHVHLSTGMPWAPTRDNFGDAPIYLAYGITTVMNMGDVSDRRASTQLEWRAKINSGEMLGPTIYTSGPFVNEPRVTTPQEVEQDIVAQARKGYDFIKFHEIPCIRSLVPPGECTTTGLSLAAYRQMVNTANRVGIPLIGHAPFTLGGDEMLRAKQSIAHVGMMDIYFLSPPGRVLPIILAACAALIVIALVSGIASIMRLFSKRANDRDRPAATSALRATHLISTMAGLAFVALMSQLSSWIHNVHWFFIALAAIVMAAATTATLPTVRMVRDSTVARLVKMRAVLVVLCALAISLAMLTFWVPVSWRSSGGSIERVAQRVRDAGMYVVSSLVTYESERPGARTALDGAVDYLSPATRAAWRERPPRPFAVGPYYRFMQKVVGALHRHGVPILAGTDAIGLRLPPGSSLHRELELLAGSGLSPYEVIRSATAVPAAFLKRSNEFGTIAVGQRADLLLVSANPLENLTTLKRPTGVMVRGKWLSKEELDELLERLKSAP